MLKYNFQTVVVALVGILLINGALHASTSSEQDQAARKLQKLPGIRALYKRTYEKDLSGIDTQKKLEIVNADINCIDEAINEINGSGQFTINSCVSRMQNIMANAAGISVALSGMAGAGVILHKKTVPLLEQLKSMHIARTEKEGATIANKFYEFFKPSKSSTPLIYQERQTALRALGWAGLAATVGATAFYIAGKVTTDLGGQNEKVTLNPQDAKNMVGYLETMKADLVSVRNGLQTQ